MVSETIETGISLLRGGNIEVQKVGLLVKPDKGQK